MFQAVLEDLIPPSVLKYKYIQSGHITVYTLKCYESISEAEMLIFWERCVFPVHKNEGFPFLLPTINK
jgi:hypothetical protein